MSVDIRVQTELFDSGEETQSLKQASRATGAVVTFEGLVSDLNKGERVYRLTLEHYPGMTEKALRKIVDQAFERWPLLACRLVHRVGTLEPSEPIVYVGVASRHRAAAFEACQFIMDFLKTEAPFWKKEATSEGEGWLQQRDQDIAAKHRWS